VPARSPTVRRRRLAIELRRLREAAGLTIEQVAAMLECSDSKISRIETGQVGATPRDVRDMLEIYGVANEQRAELIQIAREARQKGWWHAYGDVPVPPAVVFEAEAFSMSIFQSSVVPGLLQIEDYARAVLRATRPELPLDQIERRVELRMARQSILTRDQPPVLWAVLDEAVIRRLIGGPEVMRQQLERLSEADALPNVTLQLLPFARGEHAGLGGEFTLIGFPDPGDLDVVYIEMPSTDLWLEDPASVRQYHHLFDLLRAAALSPAESAELITKAAKELH
jgi:transcriptional regulator with XRE-family HTH domain